MTLQNQRNVDFVHSGSYVYFMRQIGTVSPVKIGFSAQPEGRLRDMMAWSPEPLEIFWRTPGGRDLELNLHQSFARCHSHGEWFRPDAAMFLSLHKMVTGAPIAEAVDLTVRQRLPRNTKDRPDRPMHVAYIARLRGTAARMARQAGGDYAKWPERVQRIMADWKTNEGRRAACPPNAEGLAYLDSVLADPMAHLTIYERERA